MKTYQKFLENNLRVRELLDLYLVLRQHFQELGFSEKDLKNPPIYTDEMFHNHSQFMNNKNTLLKQMNDYGFEIDDNELNTYLAPLLNKIDELTPLSYVNYKRRD